MIIKGFVETDKGPVEIAELTARDKVLDRMHRPRKVLAVEAKEVSGGFAFAKNPGLILAKDSTLRTLYGDVVLTGDTEISMLLPTSRRVQDSAKSIDGTYTAYAVTIEDSDALYVSQYCVKAGT